MDETIDEEMKYLDINGNEAVFKYKDYVAGYNKFDSLRTEWKSSGTAENLFKNFKSYVDICTDARNYQADMVLKIDYNNGLEKLYNNFSAVVGYIEKGSIEKEYVYPISICKGQLVTTDKGYKELINQIARDYILEEPDDEITAEARAAANALFQSSEIWKCLVEAMETCENDKNTSTNDHKLPENKGAETLGNDEHWYDEETRTFVIRRYKCEENIFKDIVMADKLDLGAVAGDSMDGGSSKLGIGKFYFTLYYDPNKESNYNKYTAKDYEQLKEIKVNGIEPKYNPLERWDEDKLKARYDDYSVIIDLDLLEGSYFIVPMQTTSDF